MVDDPLVTDVVIHGDEFEGVVTQRQLATFHHPPDDQAGPLVWHVSGLDPHEEDRAVARIMTDSDTRGVQHSSGSGPDNSSRTVK